MPVVTAALLTLAPVAGGTGPASTAAAATATAAVPRVAGPLVLPTRHRALPPGRRIVVHRVRPGDTVTGLAVRYRAWTAEVVSLNHLGPSAGLVVGQRLRIPVVRAAVRGDRDQGRDRAGDRAGDRDRPRPGPGPEGAARRLGGVPAGVDRAAHRAAVRRQVLVAAARNDVPPRRALAIAWQESGWRMGLRSSAGARGAMQVLPGTAEWMESYVGRRLRVGNLRDNVAAGVTFLRVLEDMVGGRRRVIGAYYQGPGAVREHGLYRETERYVASVVAIARRLGNGLPPA